MVAKESSGTSKPPHKRAKTDVSKTGEGSNRQDVEPLNPITSPPPSALNGNHPSTAILSPELAFLQAKYEFATMSIISSVKMEQKIRVLLSHLARFNYADVHCKPGVVALHAKAPVAGKMISIVEIAKREIQNAKGQWWQYSRCHGELLEWKQKAARVVKGTGVTAGAEREMGDAQGLLPSRTSEANDSMEVDGVDEEEAAFETMSPKKVAEHIEARKKVRAVPIMTIYMSRVPIPEFKSIYGYAQSDRRFSNANRTFSEQTNCPKGA